MKYQNILIYVDVWVDISYVWIGYAENWMKFSISLKFITILLSLLASPIHSGRLLQMDVEYLLTSMIIVVFFQHEDNKFDVL